MELRVGKIVNGQIVLDDPEGLPEGTHVSVWVGEPEQAVDVTAEEHAVIDQGLAAADAGELINARAFLRELRRSD